MGGKLQHDSKKVIHSFSSYNLSQTEASLLLKGLNFSLPPKKLKFENHLPYKLWYRMFCSMMIIKMNFFI